MQTLLGCKIDAHETLILASVFGMRVDFLYSEESIDPWEVESAKYRLEIIEDLTLREKTTNAMMMDLCKLHGIKPSQLFETELFEQNK